MGTELLGPCFKEDSMEISSIPPGFESLAAKRMEDNQDSTNSGSSCASNAQNITSETQCDNSKNSSSFCRRSGMKYKKHDSNSSDHIEFEQNISRNWLPKGVIRGCEACDNCQKVKAKWRPEESRRPDLEEAPVFYPSKEEFEDTLKYISSIRAQAETYGICRIVPPPTWSPPCPLKENNIWKWSEFSTRVQRVDKLQNRDTMRKLLEANRDKKRKRRRCLRREVDNGNITQDIKISGDVGWSQAESFGFEPGPDFTLDAFQKYDDDFKAQYFREYYNNSNSGGNRIMPEQLGPAVEDIEGEYWRIVETPTEEIEVLYGADLDTGAFGSGFPKNSQQVASASDSDYINSGWNLNNFPRLPGSVLSFESSDISGVVVPWLYVGMCFSTFCWHVEDHHMYSLNYMHWGAPKMWYGVPGSGAVKLEAAMRKHLPDLFEEQPDLLHKLVTQLSPSILRSEGVPVYRCIQNAGEFVLTFPRAYHAGFNCGFNCAEAVNIAPVDWLPHGQTAVELYREQGRRTSISHDKLLLGSARESVKANWECDLLRKYNSNNLRWKEVCGKDGILSRTLKNRVEMERMWREFLSESSQVLTMESSFDANSERECTVCFFDLHLSAVGCHHCSPNKYACLKHAKELCSCSWGARFFLFRYDISELNMLVEALEGNLSALYRWARRDMGFALTSYVARKNAEIHTSQGSVSKEVSSPTEEQEKQVHGGSLNITKYTGDAGSSRIVRPPMVVLALPCVRTSNRYSQQVKSAKSSIPCEKDNSLQPPPAHKLQSSQVGRLKLAASDHSEGNHLSFSEHKGVIVLSDDEEDEPSKKLCVRKGTSHNHTITMAKPVFPDNTTNLGGCINEAPLTNSPCVKVPLTDVDSNKDDSGKKGTRESDEANAQCPQVQIDEGKSNSEDGNKRSDLDVEFRSVDNMLTVSSPTSHQTDLDRCHRQKGPRIAKVVRRIKCKVEALDFGTVRAGKLWCDSRAIYPKGFRSRVRYIDVVDPTSMCHYVSEILDAGLEGPLFMVSVEHSPNEVFIHTSANRCWELVRQRVNQEIMKQHKLGKGKLPPLQPFGSVDGMEMFGFSSPAILQVIQSKDQNRVCTEYWQSHPPIQIPTQPQSVDNSADSIPEPLARKSHTEVETTLNSLFEKANPEELHTLYSLLNNKSSADEQRLLSRLLSEKINKQSI